MKLRIARDFDLLWAGESISALGTQLSTLALPTLAILDLHASPFEVGVLAACSFGGYPGFVAHPYREYSEVFFGERYRVLRGGAWATDARVASPTFRNWDLPERRQIFAGARLARDLR